MKKYVNGAYIEMTEEEISEYEELAKNLPEEPQEPTMSDLMVAIERGAYHMITDVIEALVRWAQASISETTPSMEDKTLAISCAALFREWKSGNYKAGDIRTDGKTPYECILDHDSTVNPDYTIEVRTLWKPYHSRQKQWALPWIQPTGAHDMYKSGEYMVYTDGTIWHCLEDTNFNPEEYPPAWEIVE